MPISTTYNPNAPSATSGQGSAVAMREDLSNEVYLLAPEETPLLSLCAKTKAKSTYHEWSLDKLDSARTTGVSEGEDVSAFDDKFAGVARVGNYVQKLRRAYLVSDLLEASDTAGQLNIVKAEAKALRELKRDLEKTINSDNEMTVENGGGTPYAMRGLGTWISNSAQSTNPVPSDYRTPSGSILGAAPTEITMNDVIASIYSVSGETQNLTLIAGIALRKTVANFTRTDGNSGEGVYNVMQDADSKKVVLSVQLFDSDFGVVRLVNANNDCVVNSNRGYFVNPKFLEFASYIPMSSRRLPNMGGGERGLCEVTGTLVVKHPGAFGKIAHS